MANHPFDWNTWSGLDATELAQSINEGDVSVPEVMAQLADAVSIQNPSLNAVIELNHRIERWVLNGNCVCKLRHHFGY